VFPKTKDRANRGYIEGVLWCCENLDLIVVGYLFRLAGGRFVLNIYGRDYSYRWCSGILVPGQWTEHLSKCSFSSSRQSHSGGVGDIC